MIKAIADTLAVVILFLFLMLVAFAAQQNAPRIVEALQDKLTNAANVKP